MINKKGSAYILVLITTMIIFISLSTVMVITRYQIEITNVISKNINDYHMAVSGIEKTENLINRELNNNIRAINKGVFNILMSKNKEEILIYKIDSMQNKYNGNFNIKDGFVLQTFNDIANRYIKESFGTMLHNYSYRYEVMADDGAGGYVKYEIEVTITPLIRSFEVRSRARNTNTGNVRMAQGVIKLRDSTIEETITPTFKWYNSKSFADFSVYVQGEVVGIYDNWLIAYNRSIDINENVILQDTIWSYQNPVIINNHIQGNFIDISKFYINEIPIATFIINDNYSDITIYSSDQGKKEFNGIIFSKGSVFIDNINIKGTVISLEDFIVLNGIPELIADSDMIFKISLDDMEMYYRILDYLRVTNFYSISQIESGTAGKIRDILLNVSFRDNFEYNYISDNKLQYYISTLRQIF